MFKTALFLVILVIAMQSKAIQLGNQVPIINPIPIEGSQVVYGRNINLNCLVSNCQMDTMVAYYLSSNRSFSQDDVQFSLVHEGLVIQQDYLSSFLDRAGAISIPIEPGFVYEYDHPLDCRYDTDFTCDDWRRSIYTGMLIDYLDQMPPIQITVTQQMIDDNRSAVNFVASMIVALPTGPLLTVLARLGSEYVFEQVVVVIVAGGAWSMTDSIADFFADNGVQAGDILVIDGAGENYTVTIIRNDGSGSSVISSGGSSSGGANTQPTYRNVNTNPFRPQARRVCTGIHGERHRCYTVWW